MGFSEQISKQSGDGTTASFNATNGKEYIFIYGKDGSVDENSDNATITFSNGNFNVLVKYITLIQDTKYKYIHHIDKLTIISKILRGYYIRKINALKGEGFLNSKHINNETDFLHFIDIKDIDYYNFIGASARTPTNRHRLF